MMDWQTLSNDGGFILGILGIILSFYFYFKSIDAKEPVIFCKTFQDIRKPSNLNTNIKILYKKNEEDEVSTTVDEVCTTYVWFWNRGRKAIRNISPETDIPDGLFLEIIDEKQGLQILDFQIRKVSSNDIKFQPTQISETCLSLNFRFLNHNDGAVIEIQHTGSYKSKLKVKGAIIGLTDGAGVKELTSMKQLGNAPVYFGMRPTSDRSFKIKSSEYPFPNNLYLN
jgi:hypothetical protein